MFHHRHSIEFLHHIDMKTVKKNSLQESKLDLYAFFMMKRIFFKFFFLLTFVNLFYRQANNLRIRNKNNNKIIMMKDS